MANNLSCRLLVFLCCWYFWLYYYALSVSSKIQPFSENPLNWNEQTPHSVEFEGDNKPPYTYHLHTHTHACLGLCGKAGCWMEGRADIKTPCREVELRLNLFAPDGPLDVLRLTQFSAVRLFPGAAETLLPCTKSSHKSSALLDRSVTDHCKQT